MPMHDEERAIGALITDLMHEMTTLVRKQVELARAEMAEKVDQVQNGLTELAIGGAVLYAGFLVLLFAIAAALDELLDQWWETSWLAPLIVGLVVLLIGGIVLQRGRSNIKGRSLMPQRTFESIRRDGYMVREQVR